MRVVVTGGAGFIGANLCRTLVGLPEVSSLGVIDDFSSGSRDNLEGFGRDVEVVEGTILDRALLERSLRGCQVLVHLAARPSVPRSLLDPLATHAVNATGTINVMEAARQAATQHVIVSSSSSVYGANTQLPKHEGLVPEPVSPYAASKLAAEQYALCYARSYGMDVLVWRFFNVFGPLQRADHAYAAVIPAFISAALEQRSLPIHGDGGQTRDFTYVGDVVRLIREAILGHIVSATPVNLAFGTRRSLLDVVAMLESLLCRSLPREHQPTRPGDVRDSQADQSHLRALFPRVQPASFEVGLSEALAWSQGSLGTS